jgi:hypothetical protein
MKIDDQTREALASYTGPIMRCRPGKARGHAVKPQPLPDSVSKKVSLSIVHEAQCMKHDAATQWLSEHRDICRSSTVPNAAEVKKRERGETAAPSKKG